MADNKAILYLGGLAAAVGVAYYFLKTNCAGPSPVSFCTTFGLLPLPPANTTPGGSTPGGSTTTPGGSTATPGGSISADPYDQAAARMNAAAGAGSGQLATQTFDLWSWYWQNGTKFTGAPAGYGTPDSISPDLMSAIIVAGGGDRTKKINAADFVNYFKKASAASAGVSGFYGIPAYLIHRRGF